MQNTSAYRLPARIHTEDATIRQVGFELEFSGLSLEQAASAVTEAMGGVTHVNSVAQHTVEVPDLGSFVVELDWEFLKQQAQPAESHAEGPEWLEPLSRAAAMLVPVEVVCPPVPITHLDRLDPMVQALRKAGATGTGESIIAAYGLHINVELPSLDPVDLHDYLRAFCLLQWWLVDAHEVDLARRLSPYIDLYPQAYVRQVLATDAVSMRGLVADYLQHNPTRNRALDMLPLFAYVDEAAVRAVVDDDKVKARPTFHYRLPNCEIDLPDWSLAKPWNTWCLVESLAQRRDHLDQLSSAFLDANRWVLGVDRGAWVQFLDKWLCDHVSE